VFIGVEKPMKVYTFDNLIFTSAKVPDDFVYKVLDALEKNKAELVSVQPVLREFTPAFGYKEYNIPYHPGAVKYYTEHNIKPSRATVSEERIVRTQRSSPPLRRGDHTLRPTSCKRFWSPASCCGCSTFHAGVQFFALYRANAGGLPWLTLALAFVVESSGKPTRFEWSGIIATAAICAYIAYRHPD